MKMKSNFINIFNWIRLSKYTQAPGHVGYWTGFVGDKVELTEIIEVQA
jgi:hypothetical protein